ncbi:MAG: DUF4367 domain-containing protein [Anaerovoracaceae bacterium]
MENKLKMALAEAMLIEYRDVPEPEGLCYEYKFSVEFEDNLEKVVKSADYKYVSVGSMRIRKALAVALIAAMIMAASVCAVAAGRAIVHWNETQNDKAGTLDVTFDVEDPNGTAGEFSYIKPETPEGYEIVLEEKYPTAYRIQYVNSNNKTVLYSHTGGIDSMGLGIDNEEAEFNELIINGEKGYSYSKLGNNMLIWADEISLYQINGNCDMEVLQEMARSIC